jgi:hypothetical protein
LGAKNMGRETSKKCERRGVEEKEKVKNVDRDVK